MRVRPVRKGRDADHDEHRNDRGRKRLTDIAPPEGEGSAEGNDVPHRIRPGGGNNPGTGQCAIRHPSAAKNAARYAVRPRFDQRWACCTSQRRQHLHSCTPSANSCVGCGIAPRKELRCISRASKSNGIIHPPRSGTWHCSTCDILRHGMRSGICLRVGRAAATRPDCGFTGLAAEGCMISSAQR